VPHKSRGGGKSDGDTGEDVACVAYHVIIGVYLYNYIIVKFSN